MSEAWFYWPDLPEPESRVILSGREARHAFGARRLAEGDALRLFDGCGRVALATVEGVETPGRRATLGIRSVTQAKPLRPAIHLACALPKGDRQSTLLTMAAQLGLDSFSPLRTERRIVKPTTAFSERAQRWLVESCKQSRQAHLPRVGPERTIDEVVGRAADSPGGRVLIAHPNGGGMASIVKELEGPEVIVSAIDVLIGPEGGFTPGEVERAEAAGAKRVSLGPTILRIETAAVVVLGTLRALLSEPPAA